MQMGAKLTEELDEDKGGTVGREEFLGAGPHLLTAAIDVLKSLGDT